MKKRIIDGAGWIRTDERASGGELVEDDMLGCGHCPRPIPKRKWEADGGFKCWKCDKVLCRECAAAPPRMECPGSDAQQIEKALSDNHRREQNAKVLGI